MAKISNTSAYPQIVNPDVNDYVILTDKENQLKTKSCTLGALQGLFGSTMLAAHVEVNSAKLLNLPSQTINLIDSPGKGKVLNILEIMFYMDAGSVAYDFSLPSTIQIAGAASGITIVPSSGSFPGFNMATDQALHLGNTVGTFYDVPDDAALTLAQPGTVTQGNGTAYFNILYRVLDLGPNF